MTRDFCQKPYEAGSHSSADCGQRTNQLAPTVIFLLGLSLYLGDEFHHGAHDLDPRSLPKGPKPRDIENPYRHLDQIRVKTRDFR